MLWSANWAQMGRIGKNGKKPVSGLVVLKLQVTKVCWGRDARLNAEKRRIPGIGCDWVLKCFGRKLCAR